MIDWLIDWPIDGLIDRFIVCLIDWKNIRNKLSPKLCTASASEKSCSVPENKVLSSTLFREMPTFSCKFNHNHYFSSWWKVDIAGITGPVQFDGNGRRIVSRLEILNLRNDSFKRVSSMKAMNNPIFFSSDWVFWKRKTLDWISTTIDIKKGFFKRVGTVDLNHPVLLSASTSFNSKTEFLLLLTLLMCRWSSSIRKGTSLPCYFYFITYWHRKLNLAAFPRGGILGDPGADKGGERKSKRAEKYIWNEEK